MIDIDSDHQTVQSKHSNTSETTVTAQKYCQRLSCQGISRCRLAQWFIVVSNKHYRGKLTTRQTDMFVRRFLANCFLSFSAFSLSANWQNNGFVKKKKSAKKLAAGKRQLWVKLAMPVMIIATTTQTIRLHIQMSARLRFGATLMIWVLWANQWWQFQLEHQIKKSNFN